jgi:signal transduction histidine kinase
VTAGKEGNKLLIVIKDNGCGFDQDAIMPSRAAGRSLGLTSIAKRAQILGGISAIVSVPGRGTTITITLNLPEGRHGC